MLIWILGTCHFIFQPNYSHLLIDISCSAVVGLFGLQLPVSAEDYCNPVLCKYNQLHVACRKKVQNGANCSENAQQIKLTPELQSMLVKEHNNRRSEVATGSLPGFPSAANMFEMVGGFCVNICKSLIFVIPEMGQNISRPGRLQRSRVHRASRSMPQHIEIPCNGPELRIFRGARSVSGRRPRPEGNHEHLV